MDNLIEARELQIERKHFHVEFRENDRGRFLRITEDSQGHRNVIIVPISGVDDFADAIDFVNAVAEVAEDEEHHPDIDIRYNKVRLVLSTHSKGGLTELDFGLAERIDTLSE